MNNLIQEFIDKHVIKVKPLLKKIHLASWNANISGKNEFYDEYERLQIELEKIYNNKEIFERLKKLSCEEIKDDILRRQIKILYNQYLSSQGDIELIKQIVKTSTEIEKKFNLFRAEFEGKQLTGNEISEILKNENNSERLKGAWEASKNQGELVEKDVIYLVKLRNKLARSLGFEDYYLMSLELREQPPAEIETVFKELAELTKGPFRKLKEEMDSTLSNKLSIDKKKLKPWHYQDPFFQQGPKIYAVNLDDFYSKDVLEIAKNFYASIGMNVEDILERSDLYEKPGKYPHACCMDLDREGDVRIIQNMKDNERWMETTLHELGHGVYQKFMDKKDYESLPFILRGAAHIFTTEAIALLFGRLSKNVAFIKKYVDINNEDPNKLKEELFNSLRLRQLVFSRWSQVMVNFEREMYKNPDQNLNKLWWELVKEYQLIDFYRDKPDWAAKIHLVSAPVYYHNYLLGELLASQIHNYLVKNILNQDNLRGADYSDNNGLGEYLIDNIFSIGKKFEWNDMIKRATGEKLNPKYFVDEFI